MSDGVPSCCAGSRADPVRVPAEPARGQARIEPGGQRPARRWSMPIGGTFIMGSGDTRFPEDGEGPARQVSVGVFVIACHAVSNLQFAEFVRATGYTTDAERYGWSFVFAGLVSESTRRAVGSRAAETPWWLPVPHAYWAQPEGPPSTVVGRLDHPAVHISWNDARAYCRWSGARLPSEAEWEMAARGGLEQAIFPWGNELTPEGEHRCNIWQGRFPEHDTAEDGHAGTAPVHAYRPNGHGLYNMAGNVWEWCEDYFSPAYHRVTSGVDPRQDRPTARRSLRGGSYLCHQSYCNRYRVAARSSNTPDSSAGNIGFRVVRCDGNGRSAP